MSGLVCDVLWERLGSQGTVCAALGARALLHWSVIDSVTTSRCCGRVSPSTRPSHPCAAPRCTPCHRDCPKRIVRARAVVGPCGGTDGAWRAGAAGRTLRREARRVRRSLRRRAWRARERRCDPTLAARLQHIDSRGETRGSGGTSAKKRRVFSVRHGGGAPPAESSIAALALASRITEVRLAGSQFGSSSQ